MANIYFEMEFDAEPVDEELPALWKVSFYLDSEENTIRFTSVTAVAYAVPGDRYEDIEWTDFLKVIGKEADGHFVEHVYKLAEAHVELNLDNSYDD